jgi:hypothetical protein
VRALVLLAAALVFSAWAQDKEPVAKKKRAATPIVHRKPTPEQLRKFDQLEKKQEAPQKK